MPTVPPPLAGLRVLDLSDGIAGQFCARLMADYGADVTLAEPPDGTATRRMHPLDAAGGSWMFAHLNRGKRSAVPEPGRLPALVAGAEVVVADAEPPWLRAANPRCTLATVTPFGTAAPWRDWQGCELVFQALSGTMNNNGEPGRPPLYGCGHRASFAAGLAAYAGVLAARFAGAAGQTVSVSVAEVAASMTTSPVAFAYSGLREGRSTPEHHLSCADGWIAFWLYSHQWSGFCRALGLLALEDDPRFASADDRQRNWPALMDILRPLVADQPAAAVVARLRAHRVIAAAAATLTELLDDPHLASRGFWGEGGAMRPPFRMGAA